MTGGDATMQQALSLLQGELAADPGLAGDETRFNQVADSIAERVGGGGTESGLRDRLRAMRSQFAEAGS